MYVSDGMFVARPARVDSVIDLASNFVVPPFAEAHNHNVEASPRLDSVTAAYLRAGVFYVQNPNGLPSGRAALTGRVNTRGTLDVSIANGGFTGPGGHPLSIAQRNIERGAWSVADGDGSFYHVVRDRQDVDAAWPKVLQSQPGIVKVFLLYSDEYASRLRDSATVGWRGMDPALLPAIVQRARREGVRVVAHIETAADFRVAVTSGVHQIAHLPGFRGNEATLLPDLSKYLIQADDAERAAQQGTVVVTTVAGLARYAAEQGDTALRRSVERLAVANIAVLRRHGVMIAIGSDEYSDNSVGEALYLKEIGAFGPDVAVLLRAWTETTTRAIFPDRRLGRLRPGYEASFVSLAGNPLHDFANIRRIARRVKQGVSLDTVRRF